MSSLQVQNPTTSTESRRAHSNMVGFLKSGGNEETNKLVGRNLSRIAPRVLVKRDNFS